MPTGPGDVLFGSLSSTRASSRRTRRWKQPSSRISTARTDLTSAGPVSRRRTNSRAGFVNTFDLRFSQELPGFFEGHKAEIWVDIQNVGNLLNKKWGHIVDYGFFANVARRSLVGICRNVRPAVLQRQVRVQLPQRPVRPGTALGLTTDADGFNQRRLAVVGAGGLRSTSSDIEQHARPTAGGNTGRFLLSGRAQTQDMAMNDADERSERRQADRPLPTVNARISPRGGLDILSRDEIARLRDASSGGLHELLRRCALAVLTTGSDSDDPRAAQQRYPDFDIQVHQQDRGIKIELISAPALAFVDGEMIRGVAELLFAVVRDIVYVAMEIYGSAKFDLGTSDGITGAVFEILRNARVLRPHRTRTWWSAGAATRSAATSTTTPRRSATSWACAAWTSARVAARAR